MPAHIPSKSAHPLTFYCAYGQTDRHDLIPIRTAYVSLENGGDQAMGRYEVGNEAALWIKRWGAKRYRVV